MGILKYLFGNRDSTASIAKERLQLVIAHERTNRSGPAYLPMMRQDIINVIRKYVPIEDERVNVHMGQDGSRDVLELNITLSQKGNIKKFRRK